MSARRHFGGSSSPSDSDAPLRRRDPANSSRYLLSPSEVDRGTQVEFPGMDLVGIDADRGWNRRREAKARQTAVVRIGIGDLAFQRDSRPESVGRVDRHAPHLLVVGADAGRRGAEDRRSALLPAGIDALNTEGPGVDGVAAAPGHEP